jgi:hypothetical protein
MRRRDIEISFHGASEFNSDVCRIRRLRNDASCFAMFFIPFRLACGLCEVKFDVDNPIRLIIENGWGQLMDRKAVASFFTLGLMAGTSVLAQVAPREVSSVDEAAQLFGAMPAIDDLSLSPDGANVAFIAPAPGRGNDLFVVSTQE